MNPDFENLTDDIAAAAAHPGWDSGLPLPAALSYFANKGKRSMPEPTKSTADIILAGVESCLLAINTIEVFKDAPHARAQAIVAASRKVLAHWGLEIKVPAAPAGTDDPQGPLGAGEDAPSAPVASKPAVLIWPPREPMLPAVYTENFYVPRESFLAWVDGVVSVSLADATFAVLSTDRLIFTGAGHWSVEHNCWVLRMIVKRDGLHTIWALSKRVVPGDEIPKVIDASKIAGNTDP